MIPANLMNLGNLGNPMILGNLVNLKRLTIERQESYCRRRQAPLRKS